MEDKYIKKCSAYILIKLWVPKAIKEIQHT